MDQTKVTIVRGGDTFDHKETLKRRREKATKGTLAGWAATWGGEMRSTLEILIAVTECQPATEEELRLALQAMSGFEHFASQTVQDLIEAIEAGKPAAFLRMKVVFAKDQREQLFRGKKRPVDEWLGPANIPGTVEQRKRLELGKAIFKKATGLDL